jgi:hypothetical protein
VAAPPALPDSLLREIEARFEHKLESAFGRQRAAEDENRKLIEELATKDANRKFVEDRANELAREKAELEQKLREAQELAELGGMVKGFQSELVGSEQFAEIARGLNPKFRKVEDVAAFLTRKVQELEAKLAETGTKVKEDLTTLDRKQLDREFMRANPDSRQMFQSKEGQEFLHQRIPGSRRTRLMEFQEAYEAGDLDYMNSIVSDWKRLGKPQSVPPAEVSPTRIVQEQTPRVPVAETLITEDMLSDAWAKVRNGDLTKEKWKEMKATYDRQNLGR